MEKIDKADADVRDGAQVVDASAQSDPWQALRGFTAARIALGRTGISVPTAHHLDFQLAHARARDAVHHALDFSRFQASVAQRGWEGLELRSAAGDRRTYLQRPDLGRCLDAASRQILEERALSRPAEYDVVFVVADGLSAQAIEKNALPLLDALQPFVRRERWRVAPVVTVEQGRVAVGDEVGQLLGARMVVVLIGERPGLSSPDSLGIYLTYQPRIGTADAARNCISNVRAEGMSTSDAAAKLAYLMSGALTRGLTGVLLKDELAEPSSLEVGSAGNFLVAPDMDASKDHSI